MSSTPEKPTDRMVSEAISYAVTHGIVVAQSKTSPVGTYLSHAPFTIYPSSLPQSAYNHAWSITPSLNTLVHAIAKNKSYIWQVLSETAKADPGFTGRLLSLMFDDKKINPIQLSLCRFDYFIDQKTKQICMVELNCIAASFAALGFQTMNMHKHLNSHPSFTSRNHSLNGKFPNDDNQPLNGFVTGIAKAHDLFIKTYGSDLQGISVKTCMIVQPDEKNAYDQYILQDLLWNDYKIDMIRITLGDLHMKGKLQNNDSKLFIYDNETILSVVYFRAGYTPDDYPTEIEWKGRQIIEQSVSVKTPSIPVQLVGTKKIQQLLSLPKQLEKFLSSTDSISEIRKTFVPQLSLSPQEGNAEKNTMIAVKDYEDWVLKPQREGGGNNLYGEDMKETLLNMSVDEKMAYVLMKRIRPAVSNNYIVRNGECVGPVEIVSELGLYGVILQQGDHVIDNYAAGTLLRSKSALQDDGGVAAGVAVLDSPLLE